MQRITCIVVTVFVSTQILFSQITISGPQCVTGGTVYQYIITGNFDSAKTQVCITNGNIAGSSDNCSGGIAGQIKVIWNTEAATGFISFSSSRSNTSLNVNITPSLQGGIIDASIKTQTINKSSVPVGIRCSPATGGACNPQYVYQWQQSENGLKWEDITNATSQNLVFTRQEQKALFYRRKVTETLSKTIQYSDMSALYLTGL